MFRRDAAGRVTQSTLPDSSVIGFGFDANGNLDTAAMPDFQRALDDMADIVAVKGFEGCASN